ncbi:MAG: carbohydrate kinase [Truepera sp.]|nr:carbohydrate kinase [Truepera sp.]
MRIVCCGEALIDFKATGPLAFQGYVGGSPLNVAVAASRLGVPVGFVSQLSSDMFGDAIRRAMVENGIDMSLVRQSDAPSTLAFVSELAGDVHFSFLSNGAADTLYDPQPRPQLPASVRLLEFGSISLLCEPTASAITDIVAAHQDRCAVIFDPNVRPALIHDRDVYLAQLPRWLSLSRLVKVSTQDLSWLYPDQEPARAAAEWLTHGPQAVIVTQGWRGVSLLRAGKPTLTVPAPQVEVKDTVGAGDTFTGALMVALLEHDVTDLATIAESDWLAILAFAAAAAAINCTRAGAQPPYRDELVRFMAALS